MKRNVTSLAIREMLIKTTMRHQHSSIRITKIKNSATTNCWWECWEAGSLIWYWWEYKMVRTLWKTPWQFLKKTKHATTIQPSNGTPGHLSRRNENLYLHTKKPLYMKCSHRFIYNNPQSENNFHVLEWVNG